MTTDQYFDQLIERGIATQTEIELVTDINGYSNETLDSILYARTGYRSLDQIDGECDDDDDEDYDKVIEALNTAEANGYFTKSVSDGEIMDNLYEILEFTFDDDEIDVLDDDIITRAIRDWRI